MKFKHLHFKNFILVAILALMSGSAWAYDFSAENEGKTIYYNITDDVNHYVEVTHNGNTDSYVGDIVVPETVVYNAQTYTVTAIGMEAFRETATTGNVTSVVLPSTITSIGREAFRGCNNMTSVNIPDAVTSIGYMAFMDCRKLMQSDGVLIIPDAVTTIGSYAFQACWALSNVTIGTGVTSIGDGAFMGCTGIEDITYNATNCTFGGTSTWSGCTHACTLTIANGVDGVPNNAFRGLTGLNSIVWGEHTTFTIGDYAFYGCMGLTTLTVPEFVTSIGYGTFANLDNLTRVNYNATNCAVNEYAWTASNVYINRNTHLEIGNNVTHLSGRPFAHFTDLTTVTIGTGVVSMDGWTFYESDHIETVNYNATNCTTVAEDIWKNCSALRTVNIGDYVTHIGKVFYRTDITSVNFGEHPSLEVIRNSAFRYCDDLTSLNIPNSVTTIGEEAFMDNSKIETLTIGSDVTSIGAHAFSNLSKLETINWNVANAENNLTIGGYCWYGTNTHPQTLVIGDDVLNLPTGAFDGFTGLTSITIGTRLSTLPERVFKNCSSLTSITIPANISTIEAYAFSGCSGLTSITIPSNVTSIGNYAFQYCDGLTSVNFNANCTTYGTQVWYRSENPAPASCTLTIGNNVTALPNGAFGNFIGLTSFTLSSSMTAISNNAFEYCKNLTTVDIPDYITSIGNNAFHSCSGMTSLTIGSGVDYIGSWAFRNCNHLATVNYNATNCTSIGSQVSNDWHFSGAGNGTNCTLTIGNNVTDIPDHIFDQFRGLTSLVFEDGSQLETISEYAFSTCYHLASVTMPSSVKTIGSSAFSSCTGLTSLDLGSVQTIHQNAFYGCTGLTALTIPASVTLIDAHTEWHTHGAFRNCSNLAEIWFEGTTPPNFVDPAFDGVTPTIPVYVPRGYGYPTTGAWAYFSNYIPYSRFDGGSGATGAQWNVAANWAFGIPQYNEAALINATAIVPDACVATVGQIAFTGSNYMIIENAGQLTCNSINSTENTQVTLRDGGQLNCRTRTKATVERNIAAWTTNPTVGGWYFIASPTATAINPDEGYGLLSNEYDLYRYEEANKMWRNYKQTVFPLSNSYGYLYANNTSNTLAFGGTMLACNEQVTTSNLSYACENNNFKGFNLMGNPFTHNLTAGDITLGGESVTTYYRVENGSEITATTLEATPIKPGRGFLVQATAANQNLVFNPASGKGETLKVGYISIAAGNEDFTDNAFIQVGGGNTLQKMTLGDNTPKVYVQQGNEDYAAVTISVTENEMPIAFEAAEDGTYTIAVDVKGLEIDYLHLIDNMTGADIDLLVEPSYSFEANVSDYPSRFRLVFNNGGASTGPSTGSGTFAFISNGNIIVNGEGTVQVIDMMGRIIVCKDAIHRFSTNGFVPGVYVLRLIDGEDVRTQKMVIR